MRILALIPARGGSKRLPGKNIRLLGGKPLVIWSIDVVKNLTEICDILVSTDDPRIAYVCRDAGATTPWLRPSYLATDTSSSVDVAIHALDWYEAEKGEVDGLLLLQPTSPFRSQKTVKRGIELFSSYGHQSVLGVSLTHDHPMWCLTVKDDYLVPFLPAHGLETRSQDLSPAYVVNGSFYLITPAELRSCRSFFGIKTLPLIIHSQKEVIDIDTEFDMKLAEFFLNTL